MVALNGQVYNAAIIQSGNYLSRRVIVTASQYSILNFCLLAHTVQIRYRTAPAMLP